MDYGPMPAAIGGPLPGQGLPLSGPMAYPLLVQIENTEPARPQAERDQPGTEDRAEYGELRD